MSGIGLYLLGYNEGSMTISQLLTYFLMSNLHVAPRARTCALFAGREQGTTGATAVSTKIKLE